MTTESSKVVKLRAGLYRHRSGRFIVRSSQVYEGPRGGNLVLWEFGDDDGNGGFYIDGEPPYTRLRDAIAHLECNAR